MKNIKNLILLAALFLSAPANANEIDLNNVADCIIYSMPDKDFTRFYITMYNRKKGDATPNEISKLREYFKEHRNFCAPDWDVAFNNEAQDIVNDLWARKMNTRFNVILRYKRYKAKLLKGK